MAYASPQDLMNRYSSQTLGDLVADDGNARTEAQLLTDPKILAALSGGAGRINTAVYQAGRYQPADLAALMGDDASMLIRINCDVAWADLLKRKTTSKNEDVEAARKEAELWLEKLRTGENIFNIQTAITAGNPSVTSPNIVQYGEQHLIVDYCRRGGSGNGAGVYPRRRIQSQFT